jgi:hypothetical protein
VKRPAAKAGDEEEAAPKAPKSAKKVVAAKAEAPKAESEPAKKPASGAKVLGKYDKAQCDEMVNFRTSSKKSYEYLSQKYRIPLDDVKKIIDLYFRQACASATPAGRAAMAKVPKNIRDQIVRMKKVAKKSYEFLAERFKLSQDVIQAICSEHLKRPRRHK